MKWVEQIDLMTSPDGLLSLLDDIPARLKAAEGEKKLVNLEMLFRHHCESALQIRMVWNGHLQPEKSRFAIMLANFLSQFGTLRHSIWVFDRKSSKNLIEPGGSSE